MSIVYNIAIWAPPLILAITLHEAGHAWMAHRLGDSTAKQLGRVSFNPKPHIDPVGTLLLPLLLYLTSPIIFGWAKPVPVIARNLNRPRRDMALVALAGPGANGLMIICWMLVYKVCSILTASAITDGFMTMALAGVFVNLLLAFFNLIPLPPLDGGRVLTSLLSPELALKLRSVERFGIVIVLALFFFAGLGRYLLALIYNAQLFIMQVFSIANPELTLRAFLSTLGG